MGTDTQRYILNHYVRAGLIAGYPRSGTALVRTILAQRFGEKTGTVYDETPLSDIYRKTVGHIDELTESVFYKTHDMIERDVDVPTIVIVRDPRDVFISLQRFYRERNNAYYNSTEIILGKHPWGCWSTWIKSWVRYGPVNALWLRYDNVSPELISTWAAFDQVNGNPMPDLSELQKADPSMFGPGGYTEEERKAWYGNEGYDLLWARHGGTMTMLGYYQ